MILLFLPLYNVRIKHEVCAFELLGNVLLKHDYPCELEHCPVLLLTFKKSELYINRGFSSISTFLKKSIYKRALF